MTKLLSPMHQAQTADSRLAVSETPDSLTSTVP